MPTRTPIRSTALSCLLLFGGFAAAQNGNSPSVDRLVDALLGIAPTQSDQLKLLLTDVANMNERAAQLNLAIQEITPVDSSLSMSVIEESIGLIKELNSYALSCSVRLGSNIPTFQGTISLDAENILETTRYGRTNAYKFLTETCAEVNRIADSMLNPSARDNGETDPAGTIIELQGLITRSAQAAIVQAGLSLQIAR